MTFLIVLLVASNIITLFFGGKAVKSLVNENKLLWSSNRALSAANIDLMAQIQSYQTGILGFTNRLNGIRVNGEKRGKIN